MIGGLITKKFVGGLTLDPLSLFLISIIIFIIDLLIRAYIVEWGYNKVNKKINLPTLNYTECLILVLIFMCLFRN